ncbi:hypothetical protein [Ottowia sp.]|uniref:hypothetical protein n=1 Tax=Ottowia sp. TaxID=1898956 RepID=UPI003A8A6A81
MGKYKLANGDVIVATPSFIDAHHPGAEILPEAVEVTATTRNITRLAFRNRFSVVEKTALEIASLDKATAALATRQQAAALRVYLKDVDSSTFIDLDRAETRAGVQQLEALGLLAVGRAAEILDAPIQDAERYQP